MARWRREDDQRDGAWIDLTSLTAPCFGCLKQFRRSCLSTRDDSQEVKIFAVLPFGDLGRLDVAAGLAAPAGNLRFFQVHIVVDEEIAKARAKARIRPQFSERLCKRAGSGSAARL